MAERLRANGLTKMHATTIAKIEAVDADDRTQLRGVKLDEAAAFADVFGVTVDTLMGRRARPKADLMFVLESVLHAAREARWTMTASESTLRERAAELADVLADVADVDDAGYAELVEDAERAADALAEAGLVIARVGERPDAGVKQATEEILRAKYGKQE